MNWNELTGSATRQSTEASDFIGRRETELIAEVQTAGAFIRGTFVEKFPASRGRR